jgi:hypothetical protein
VEWHAPDLPPSGIASETFMRALILVIHRLDVVCGNIG